MNFINTLTLLVIHTTLIIVCTCPVEYTSSIQMQKSKDGHKIHSLLHNGQYNYNINLIQVMTQIRSP